MLGTLAVLLVSASATPAQTRITKVSRPSVQVEAGGEAVQLTLEGFALNDITAFRLTSRGWVVTGLEAARSRLRRWLPTRGSNHVAIDLTA